MAFLIFCNDGFLGEVIVAGNTIEIEVGFASVMLGRFLSGPSNNAKPAPPAIFAGI